MDIQVGVRGDWVPRRRSLRRRFMAGYLRVMTVAAQILVGAVGGLVLVLAVWFAAMVVRHL